MAGKWWLLPDKGWISHCWLERFHLWTANLPSIGFVINNYNHNYCDSQHWWYVRYFSTHHNCSSNYRQMLIIISSLLHPIVLKYSEVDCYNGYNKGLDYKGFHSMTESGRDCQVRTKQLMIPSLLKKMIRPLLKLSFTFTNSHSLLWFFTGILLELYLFIEINA